MVLRQFSLENLGNSCYMNAILQAVLHIDLFSDSLLDIYDLCPINNFVNSYETSVIR